MSDQTGLWVLVALGVILILFGGPLLTWVRNRLAQVAAAAAAPAAPAATPPAPTAPVAAPNGALAASKTTADYARGYRDGLNAAKQAFESERTKR